ncbi:hypothetical protein CC86DRAFT_428281 [Ophiobolus disseminans]|uniref:Heterokaryon incompatibility domain-containing protein n=1 Tax=Ophiobolus disseminans TaxID=1469910 RepID=A0A6A6ZIJ8_9PLEO|nr:hypothetical protein CC86DRAFT_428281 [Ophiobolus disseminans]
MGESTDTQHAKCAYCPSMNFEDTPHNVASANQELFHTPCQRCDGIKNQDNLQLCEWCVHLRRRHVLRCYSRSTTFGDICGIMLDPFREESLECDFCQWVSGYLFESYPDLDLDNEFGKYGGIGLKFPSYRFMSEGLERDEFCMQYAHDYAVGNYPNNADVNVNIHLSRSQSSDAFEMRRGYRGFIGRINWSLIRKFLAADLRSTRESAGFNSNLFVQPIDMISDILIIDVACYSLTRLPMGSKYVALSYVWGPVVPGQIQLTTLSFPGLQDTNSLVNIGLPTTIMDAIEVCRKLDQKYLWVDSLCNCPGRYDTPESKAAQLDQMARIYQQANFTTIALAGDDASYGLPGTFRSVKPHRAFKTSYKTASDGHEAGINEASMRHLYFTDHGAYYIDWGAKDNKEVKVYQESTGEHTLQGPFAGLRSEAYAAMVEWYTRKTLTFPNDILRAFSRVLNDFHRSRTAYSLPWGDFDRAILWWPAMGTGMARPSKDADVLPSWSWISVSGMKQFTTVSQKHTGWLIGPIQPRASSCCLVRSNLPKTRICARRNCTPDHYGNRLTNRCPTYTAYWQDAFASYDNNTLFSASDRTAGAIAGRLLMHSQRASFTLDRSKEVDFIWPIDNGVEAGSCMYGFDKCFIRSTTGRLVGEVHFDQHDAQRLVSSQGGPVDFVALSMAPRKEDLYKIDFDEEAVGEPWRNDLCGCPCHRKGSGDDESAYCTDGFQHIEECYDHPDYFTLLPYLPDLERENDASEPTFETVAIPKHFAAVSYFNDSEYLMQEWWDPPAL